jgi:hypothetical protein
MYIRNSVLIRTALSFLGKALNGLKAWEKLGVWGSAFAEAVALIAEQLELQLQPA